MEAMSVLKGLKTLQMLDKKIEQAINAFQPIWIVTGDERKMLTQAIATSEKEFIDTVKEKYQSINSMLERYRAIKAAIARSNAVTEVVFDGKKMFVAQALEYKSSVEQYEMNLLNGMRTAFTNATKMIQQSEEKAERDLQALLEKTFQKESTKVKNDEYDSVAIPFMKARKLQMVDPISVQKEMQALMDRIITFKENVDVVLTESNAKTMIEI